MTYATLDDWLNEVEGYCTRRERLQADMENPRQPFMPWLEAAWRLGGEAERARLCELPEMTAGLADKRPARNR